MTELPERTCPDCGWTGAVAIYDIGSGREWCCPRCDMCHGADGQALDPRDPFRIPRALYEALPVWARATHWQVVDE